MLKKRKKPKFHRQNSHRKKRVSDSWRKPRGRYSHQREKEKSYGKRPTVGFRQPKEVRGKHPSGYYEVLVSNVNDLEKINPKTHAARIRATVGKKKRIEIIKKAEELGIKILNKGVKWSLTK